MPRRKQKFTLLNIFHAFELTKTRVSIETHNNSVIIGDVDYVDDKMNFTLSNVLFKTSPILRGIRKKADRIKQKVIEAANSFRRQDKMLVAGRHIRYVMLPKEMDVAKVLDEQHKRMTWARGVYNRKKTSTRTRPNAASASTAASTTASSNPLLQREISE